MLHVANQIGLSELLHYDNPEVVHYFYKKNNEYSFEQCQQLFKDLLSWLYLKNSRRHFNKKTYLFGPLLILDEFWHVFILHTRSYYTFCEAYFGSYVHHDVEPIGYEHQLSPEELADYLKDCFHYLGESWIERYFASLLDE